jgi:hypothetical protein
VIVASSDHDLDIITPGRLYFVLSCQLSPPDALSMQYGQRVGSGATDTLAMPRLH